MFSPIFLLKIHKFELTTTQARLFGQDILTNPKRRLIFVLESQKTEF